MRQQLQTFPIEKIRAQFPALNRIYNGKKVAYFDGPGGSQVIKTSIEAITAYMENGGANLHGLFPTSYETEAIIAEARLAVADFLQVRPNEVAFGPNMTSLTLAISRALGRDWGKDDEIVVTEMDHRANVDPWLAVAEDKGITVRWLKVDTATLTLDLHKLEELVNKNTRLVAIGLASNAVGTINDVGIVAKRAKEVGAIVAVDAVHGAPHLALDRDKLGADILLCSAYKFFGPHVGIAAIRENVFEELTPYKLKPSPNYLPDKIETGTQNHEGIAGIKPAIEFYASLGTGESRREKIVSGFARIEEYENYLANKIRAGLRNYQKVTLFEAETAVSKTPTIAFQMLGYSPEQVCKRMCDEFGFFIASGNFYASTLADRLGINEAGGWIRAGLAPYNSEEEADRFIQAIQQF